MSTAEIPNSYARHDRLSTQQNKEAAHLYWDYMQNQRARFRGRNNRRNHPTYSDVFFGPFDSIAEQVRVHNSVQKAKRHYEDDKLAYHAQAIEDARKAGVEVNFKGDEAKKVKYAKE